ncbi:P-loop containing nucleoside triphosphate hydrolase protein [Neurospora crassa]|uniref:DNA repair protein rhp57 n=2 Tax=Neurospora crassa TaxID=5141 RepID=F5HAB1_NEUCR|nr:DNA repair protein rhp57 [Neurospora crassa OR74A]EAA27958.2 DNA repair protein rhp57 [Neurospora crassa OR74A]KHE83591.1 P-loop containing nucleoside triphosphate hydrolase protein [Neurospora crassa]CAB91223.2 related to RAD57 protein [Neurospora crassa]|eukprot:XP_957194.2 DNA repair protein rhp57 [Neurospora crassa OR74A]
MTDLLRVLPHFPVAQYASLISTLEKVGLTTSDLLTLEAADIGKRTQLPLLDVKRLCAAVLAALHDDLGVFATSRRGQHSSSSHVQDQQHGQTLKNTPASLAAQWQTISTLDPDIDRALGGGIPAGYVTEITGESGAGKTQFLLTLLLSVQLPPPHGLGRPALYISTEAPLSTRRLAQMLTTNPFYADLDSESGRGGEGGGGGGGGKRPSLDNIISTVTPDLESQDHILTYQVPVEIERRNIGLLVLDSVAANYRAEFDRSSKEAATSSSTPGARSSNMGARTAELVRLGMQLRDLAQKYNLAVVVSNQVADRFGTKMPEPISSSIPRSSISIPPRSSSNVPTPSTPYPHGHPADDDTSTIHHPALHFDNQQRFFTGWGDDPYASYALKTPSLGLVWSTQISARIALFKRPAYGRSKYQADDDDDDDDIAVVGSGREAVGMPMLKSWRRWMKVVFAGWTAESGMGLGEGSVEFEVWMGGLKGVGKKNGKEEGMKKGEGELKVGGKGKGKEV